jgi:hypothetical protein
MCPRDPEPPVLGHSGYMADESMYTYVEGLASQLLAELRTGVAEAGRVGKAEIVSPPG